MKRFVALLMSALVLTALAGAQEERDLSALYRENFRNANRPIKLELLRSAQDVPGDQLAPFFDDAARYVATNVAQVASEADLQQMLRLTTAGVQQTGATASLEPLWYVFESIRDIPLRIQMLDAFAAIGGGDSDLIVRLTGWVGTQNELFRTGSFSTDLRIIDRAVRALTGFGDARSFPALVDAAMVGYSSSITAEARRGLFEMEDPTTMAIAVFRDRPVDQKPALFDFFFRASEIGDEDRDRFVTAALENVLAVRVIGEGTLPAVRLMRYQANIWLRDRAYAPATAALVGHFNRTFADFDRGLTPQPYVIEALDALGAMGTEAAARRLTEFLDVVNRQTEFGTQFNTDITLATLRNIERLGFSLSYNSLFYTTLLNYPPRVKDAARRAMAALTR